MNKATTSIAIAAVLVMIAGSSSAQTDLYSTVTNLWWEGPKTNILAIAEDGWLDVSPTNGPPAGP